MATPEPTELTGGDGDWLADDWLSYSHAFDDDAWWQGDDEGGWFYDWNATASFSFSYSFDDDWLFTTCDAHDACSAGCVSL